MQRLSTGNPGRFCFALVGSVFMMISCSKEVVITPVQITTSPVTDITSTSARCGGTIANDGGSSITIRGVCWSTTPHPTTLLPTITNDGTGTGTFVSEITGLTPGSYFVRAFAINSAGKHYGDELQFNVVSDGPEATIITEEATDITATAVTVEVNILADGGTAVTARGICWSTSHNPTADLSTKTSEGSGTGIFSNAVTGLLTWTTYYARAYATNGTGTYYGNEIVIVPIPPVVYGNVADIDGNNYKTVLIGTKTWMAESLRTGRYQDGSTISSGLSPGGWTANVDGALIDFANDAGNAAVYGHLYNAAAVTDSRKVCPAGWHIPTSSEWSELGVLLGGATVAGSRMKEPGVSHWASPNISANNSSGFGGRGGGSYHLGNFVDFGTDGYWWAAGGGSFYYLTNDLVNLRNKGGVTPADGLSIRCVKD